VNIRKLLIVAAIFQSIAYFHDLLGGFLIVLVIADQRSRISVKNKEILVVRRSTTSPYYK
jgi:hypothetical protein